MGGGASKTSNSSAQVTESVITQQKNGTQTKLGNSSNNLSFQNQRKKLYSIPRDFLDSIPDAAPRTLTSNGLISDYLVQTSQQGRGGVYEETITKLKESGSNVVFQDPEFPPKITSLTKDVSTFERGEKLVWKRPSNFLDSKKVVSIFADAIVPQDIKQGILADNYLLTALALLAEQPKLIRRIFLTSEINHYGCYGVWLCQDGEWAQYIVDDNLPCAEDSGPSFSKCNGHQIWLSLLEKAYSKAYGAYDKIECGLAGHAVRDLTGCPYVYFIRDNDTCEFEPEEVWKVLAQNLKKKYQIIASRERNERALVMESDEMGITSQYGYAILDAREVIAADGKKEQIIHVRNVWGKIDWQGDWSDSSNKWTKDTAAQLRKKPKEEGSFWIAVHDFVEEFSQLCVCKLVPDYYYSSIQVNRAATTEKVTYRLFSIKSTSQTHGWVTISQKDRRNFAKDSKLHAQFQYSLIRVMVCGLDKNAKEIGTFIGQGFECERDVDVEVNLDGGCQYVVYVEVEWAQDFSRDLVLSAYTAQPVVLNEIKINDQNIDLLINDIIDSHQAFEELERMQKYTEEIVRVSGSFCGYIYYFYENNSGNVVLKETIQMKNKRWLEVCEPYSKNSDTAVVELKPGEKQICKYRVQAAGRGEYSYATSINYILLEKIQDEEVLKEKARNNASQMKQREMNGHLMDVFVHTYVYYGGLAFLYINQTRSKMYIEDLELSLENLQYESNLSDELIHIEVPAGGEKLINLQQSDLSKDISYSTKMSYFLK